MIAVDTNILVYAHRRDSIFHAAAARLMRGLAEGTANWAVPWPCVHEFLAIVTRHSIWADPTPTARAVDQIGAWLGAPTARTIAETDQHLAVLADLLLLGQITGAKVHDARVAALCISHGVRELWTADRDFSRFPQVRARNPLIDGSD
ncbi:type II toxin-antitoxin system VapC family toxin [soil metagenome]